MRKEKKKTGTGYRVLFTITLIVVLATLGFTGYLGISASVEGRSAASKFFDLGIDLFMTGDKYVSEAETLQKVEKRRIANENYHIPSIYAFLYNCSDERYGGVETALFSPSASSRTGKFIVYFHGGSYMWQPTILHFRYCRYLADALGMDVVMPIYPKAPNYTYRETLETMAAFYEDFSSGRDIAAFVGDSAGGGLLLSFAQYLTDNGKTAPDHLVTFSPCLDLALDNADIARYTAADPMLNHADLRLKFTFYADGDLDSPYVSPIYCDYSVLGRWTCFIGTEEILLPDAQKLHDDLVSKGIDHDFYVYKNQFHTFSIFPIPEADACLNKIKLVMQAEDPQTDAVPVLAAA